MASVTLSVSPEIISLMKRFPEINWSGFIRKEITEKVKELTWKEEMLKKIRDEEPITEWAITASRSWRKGRFAALKKKGLV